MTQNHKSCHTALLLTPIWHHHIYSYMQEEAAHPRFVRMHARASYALLGLTCVQWPSFLLAAFFFYKDNGGRRLASGLVWFGRSLKSYLSDPYPFEPHPSAHTYLY